MDRFREFGYQHNPAMRTDWFGAVELLLSGFRRVRRKSPFNATAGRAIHQDALLWDFAHDRMASGFGVQSQSQTGSAPLAADGNLCNLSKADRRQLH